MPAANIVTMTPAERTSAAEGTNPTTSLSSIDTPYLAASRFTKSNTRNIGVFS